MVILIIAAGEMQVAISAFPRRIVSLVEQEKFKLRRHEGFQPQLGKTRDLLFQNGAG
ncbi:hypothetical protein D3C80_1282640 [compost metagenome]